MIRPFLQQSPAPVTGHNSTVAKDPIAGHGLISPPAPLIGGRIRLNTLYRREYPWGRLAPALSFCALALSAGRVEAKPVEAKHVDAKHNAQSRPVNSRSALKSGAPTSISRPGAEPCGFAPLHDPNQPRLPEPQARRGLPWQRQNRRTSRPRAASLVAKASLSPPPRPGPTARLRLTTRPTRQPRAVPSRPTSRACSTSWFTRS